MSPVSDADRLTAPWHVEECSDEHMENCPCIVAARIKGKVHYVADGETAELAARIVADHNAVLLAAKSSPGMALFPRITPVTADPRAWIDQRIAAETDPGKRAAWRDIRDREEEL